MTTAADIAAQIAALQAQEAQLRTQGQAISDLAVLTAFPDQSGCAAAFQTLSTEVGDSTLQGNLAGVGAMVTQALDLYGQYLTATTQAANGAEA
jgi:hypothetical protein